MDVVRLSLLTLLLLPAPAALAQEARPAGVPVRDAATLEAWKTFQAAQTETAEQRREASEAWRNSERTEADRKAYLEVLTRASARVAAAREAFRVAFEASAWDAWREPADDGLLAEGLLASAEHAAEKEPARAVRTWLYFLERFPEDPRASMVRTRRLPIAYAGMGHLGEAVRGVSRLLDDAPEADRPRLQLALGDLLAASGKIEEGRDQYEAARANFPEDLEKTEPRSPGVSILRDARLRLALVGQTPPPLAATSWMGAEARTLEQLQGRVVVVDFWATWCGPCRRVMPHLDDLHRRLASQGVQVVGATRYYDHGFLPAGPEDLNQGESVRDIPEEGFLDHLRAFRERSGLSYPYAVVPAETFRAYGIRGIPTVVVIGRDGKVRAVVVGSGQDALIEAAVEAARQES